MFTFNRTATTNGPISLAGAASLGKCGYGNGIAVMERICGTVLMSIKQVIVLLYFIGVFNLNWTSVLETNLYLDKQ